MEQQTETDPNEALVEAYIGPYNKSFYLRAFERIRSGGQGGWHWPALFATTAWLMYRKMWLYAFLYIIVLPVVHIFLTALVGMVAGETISNWFWVSTYIAIALVLAPLLANRLYYRHVQGKIAALETSGASEEQQLALAEHKGGTSVWALVGVAFMGVPLLGVMAAIVIPAYQDYTIRAQVSEGIALAGGARSAVVASYRGTGQLPDDNLSAGLPPPGDLSGTYVAAIEVYAGDIYVFYGNDAHSVIQDLALVFSATTDDQGNVEWSCASPDIANKHLPAVCRQ